MSLRSIARRAKRGEREFLQISQERLRAWAAAQGLSLRRTIELALEAGIFPEGFERNFPSLTAAEQLTLWQSRALVLGLGGLGGLQAMLLARAGVGRLYLADGDGFTPSNLNRQLLATAATLGQNKAAVTARHLREVNEAIIVEAIPECLDAKRLLDFLPSVQVLLDALDTLAARRDLINTAKQFGVPVVHGAVSGTFGQVTTILPQDPGDFTYLFPPPESAAIETAPGVLAPTVSL
ncbi:MAG TPA: ThiF family adenylyltransferase, partial [Desulfobaccales bacterium]